MSAVPMKRPKQLQSIHHHHTLSLYPSSPRLLLPLDSHPTSKAVCDTASAELTGLAGVAALKAIQGLVLYEHPHSEARQTQTLFFYFCLIIFHPVLWLWHGPACSRSLCFLRDHAAEGCVIASHWHHQGKKEEKNNPAEANVSLEFFL